MKITFRYGKIAIILLFALGLTLIALGFIKNKNSINATAFSEGESQNELTDMLQKINGIGQLQLMISTDGNGADYKITGVAVICEGGDDPRVQKDIIGIIGALWGVPSNRIYVTTMKPK